MNVDAQSSSMTLNIFIVNGHQEESLEEYCQNKGDGERPLRSHRKYSPLRTDNWSRRGGIQYRVARREGVFSTGELLALSLREVEEQALLRRKPHQDQVQW